MNERAYGFIVYIPSASLPPAINEAQWQDETKVIVARVGQRSWNALTEKCVQREIIMARAGTLLDDNPDWKKKRPSRTRVVM